MCSSRDRRARPAGAAIAVDLFASVSMDAHRGRVLYTGRWAGTTLQHTGSEQLVLVVVVLVGLASGQGCSSSGVRINEQSNSAACDDIAHVPISTEGACLSATHDLYNEDAADGAAVATWGGRIRAPACYSGCLFASDTFYFNDATGANCPLCGKADSCGVSADVRRICCSEHLNSMSPLQGATEGGPAQEDQSSATPSSPADGTVISGSSAFVDSESMEMNAQGSITFSINSSPDSSACDARSKTPALTQAACQDAAAVRTSTQPPTTCCCA